MQKLYTLLLLGLLATSVSQLRAQVCTPLDPFPPGEIVLPQPYSALNPQGGIQDTAHVGVAYTTDFHFLTPPSITLNGITLPVFQISLATTGAVFNLPPSMTYACNPPNCVFLPNEAGCVQVYGTPGAAEVGVYDLQIQATVTSAIPIPVVFPSANIAPGNYYLHVQDCPDYNTPQTATVCAGDSYTFPDGSTQVITEETTQVSTFLAVNGCDSLITTTVSVSPVDTGVTVSGVTLTATVGDAFQWIDCADNQPIAGETNASFTPTATGNYAVIVTTGACSDTSSCYNVVINSVGEIPAESVLRVAPNPTTGFIHVSWPSQVTPISLSVRDAQGRVVHARSLSVSAGADIDLSALPAGVYVVTVQAEEGVWVKRVVRR